MIKGDGGVSELGSSPGRKVKTIIKRPFFLNKTFLQAQDPFCS